MRFRTWLQRGEGVARTASERIPYGKYRSRFAPARTIPRFRSFLAIIQRIKNVETSMAPRTNSHSVRSCPSFRPPGTGRRLFHFEVSCISSGTIQAHGNRRRWTANHANRSRLILQLAADRPRRLFAALPEGRGYPVGFKTRGPICMLCFGLFLFTYAFDDRSCATFKKLNVAPREN